MKQLQIHNPLFITYTDDLFTVDVLGGVDQMQVEHMICTLRISYKDYAPLRYTLDLYADSHTDKLIRTLCDKWELKIIAVSKSVHGFIQELESYKLQRLRYPKGEQDRVFTMNEEQRQVAREYLSDKQLIGRLKRDFSHMGVLGEDENALILFLAMASHRYTHPFSVMCLAKSGIGKSYLLQRLSGCMPPDAFSYHTQISENALYYFDSYQLDGKVLFIEDMEWTHQMLSPLATLQTQGRLIKTRATKNKDGLLHSTTFEVSAKLCLIACAYQQKNYENLSLPFLCLHLNHSHTQDIAIMDYQKQCKAGLIDPDSITDTQRRLQCVIASLDNIRIINPFAPLIELPEDIPAPRRTLLLLLDFIDIVTFFFQHQRTQHVNPSTGEIYIQTTPEDITLAFSLLGNSLLRKADELSTSARGFYNWLNKFLSEARTKQFTALDIRRERSIHPRTLNRYLQELTLFHYIQITGGNKYRGGYTYRLTDLDELPNLQQNIQASLERTLERIRGTEIPQEVQQQTEAPKSEPVMQGADYTFWILKQQPQDRQYTVREVMELTKRSHRTESRCLKELTDQGALQRTLKGGQYHYTFPDSKPVGQNTVSDT